MACGADVHVGRAASFRPEVEIDGRVTRVLVEQTAAVIRVDQARARVVSLKDLRCIDAAVRQGFLVLLVAATVMSVSGDVAHAVLQAVSRIVALAAGAALVTANPR